MPHISFNNVDSYTITKFVEQHSEQLASLIGCPNDWITYYDKNTVAIIDKKVETNTCYIVIEWFKREQEKKDKVAKLIDTALREYGKKEVFINFIEINKYDYYENLEQFLD